MMGFWYYYMVNMLKKETTKRALEDQTKEMTTMGSDHDVPRLSYLES